MPILSYFAVAGSALVALLFVTDAMLPERGPLAISKEFHGVSATLHSEPASAVYEPSSAPAPKPDMKSDAIKLASQGAPAPASNPAVNLEPVNQPVARAEPAPKKRKRVAPPREWRDQYARAEDFGWSSNNRTWRNDGWRQDHWRQDRWRQDAWRHDSWRPNSWQGDRGWR